jgi:hypothetical protein
VDCADVPTPAVATSPALNTVPDILLTLELLPLKPLLLDPKVRLARTLRQDFKFASAESPSHNSHGFSVGFEPSIDGQRLVAWTGRYRIYFIVIHDYRPLECIYSHVVRHQGHNDAFL